MKINDLFFFREAIHMAQEAGQNGNLPIGAVIVYVNQIVARGKNGIWHPDLNLTRHAEMDALNSLPSGLHQSCKEMTLYTTLEPCLMCAGAILLHQIGRVCYGSADPYGGVSTCLDTLPPFFKEVRAKIKWIGPAFPEECDPLYQRIKELEGRQSDDWRLD